jgi:predicted transcriptional regulator
MSGKLIEENMNITKQDLADQSELIQSDLMCILDGIDFKTRLRVLQVIIKRIKILEEKLEEFTCENGDTGVAAWHDCPT